MQELDREGKIFSSAKGALSDEFLWGMEAQWLFGMGKVPQLATGSDLRGWGTLAHME
ncbi:hypothetical protein MPNT_90067 [Candidatus Methylacidithermus pantelleriae]|uniref:Uncharacterized protein n=1 Tax=Candidatus Methylacidithermus pantelleriae TaxID=2744239 RepID=A0A8J2BQ01_9BACT|nr:hypothetical protein MPNT_90067 [Candidatus Methylacidithermus pantelleriae]